MDPDKRRALTDFYRTEFLRHIELLESNGIVSDDNREACRCFLCDLDSVCWRADFPLLAERLLQSFDTLTHLSELDPDEGH